MDTVIGLLGLAVYVVAILAFSAGVTFVVVKVSPAQSAKQPPEKT